VLRYSLGVVRARSRLVVLAMVVVGVSAFAAAFISGPTYESEAEITLFPPNSGAQILGVSSGSKPDQMEIATQVRLMRRRETAAAVVRKLGLEDSPEQLLSRIEVGRVGMTNNVTIRATDANADAAAAIANAMADEYVVYAKSTERSSLNDAAEIVQIGLDDTDKRIAKLKKRIRGLRAVEGSETPSTLATFSEELSSLTTQRAVSNDKLDTLRVAMGLATGSARIASRAVRSKAPSSPSPGRAALLGLVVGFGFGLILAAAAEYVGGSLGPRARHRVGTSRSTRE